MLIPALSGHPMRPHVLDRESDRLGIDAVAMTSWCGPPGRSCFSAWAVDALGSSGCADSEAVDALADVVCPMQCP